MKLDRNHIINEGLLEKYWLDDLPQEMVEQVERLLQEDADLKNQYNQLEADFERMAFENAIIPPAHVKASLQTRISGPKTGTSSSKWLFVAASLTIVFSIGTFVLYQKWQSSEQRIDALQQQFTAAEKERSQLQEALETQRDLLEFINDPKTNIFVLNGNDLAPSGQAVAYVNHSSKSVKVNATKLPPLSSEKTYQMWSDVDGEMIDMGVLSTTDAIVDLKYIDHAESLNITIEPAGGNDHPTVEQLVSFVAL